MTVILEFLRAQTTSWGMCSLSHPKNLGPRETFIPRACFSCGGTGRSWRSLQALVWGGMLGFAPIRCWGDGDVYTGVCVCTA